jgi:hypothetical protein
MVETPDLTFLRQQNAELLRQLETSNERLGKVEGEIGGLKHGQKMTLGGPRDCRGIAYCARRFRSWVWYLRTTAD